MWKRFDLVLKSSEVKSRKASAGNSIEVYFLRHKLRIGINEERARTLKLKHVYKKSSEVTQS